jgi:hypothetical protein
MTPRHLLSIPWRVSPVNASINPSSAIASQPIPSPGVSKFLALKPRLFINSEWVEARSGKTLQVFDPATGKQIDLVADAGPEDVDRAVAAARAALESGPWAAMTPQGREALLWKLSDLIERDAAEFAEIESIDNGKTRFMASIVDVPGARNYFRYMAGWATKIEQQERDRYRQAGVARTRRQIADDRPAGYRSADRDRRYRRCDFLQCRPGVLRRYALIRSQLAVRPTCRLRIG